MTGTNQLLCFRLRAHSSRWEWMKLIAASGSDCMQLQRRRSLLLGSVDSFCYNDCQLCALNHNLSRARFAFGTVMSITHHRHSSKDIQTRQTLPRVQPSFTPQVLGNETIKFK